MTPPDPRPVPDRPDEWHRLSPLVMAVRPIRYLPQLIPVLIALVFAGRATPLLSFGAMLVILVLVAVLPWLATHYQVTDEHVRVRSGILTKKVATARRDRIRSVDLTATPLHRIVGLRTVTIGTGGDGGASTVELDAVGVEAADALYSDLMAPRAAAGAAYPAEGADGDVATGLDTVPHPQALQPPVVLARLDPSWLRFAPFSLTGFAIVAGGVGLAAQISNEANLFEKGAGAARGLWEAIADIPIPLVVVAALIIAIIVGALLSVLAYVLAYWNFTLTRHPDGTIRSERGLLTTNSVSFDESRVRGTHLHEPILMRPVGGARLTGIATGATKHPLLLPPAPFTEALRVADAVADEHEELSAPLRRHGPAARRRRLTRGVLAGMIPALIVGVPVVAVVGWHPWLLVLALLPVISAALGIVRYRHLGHSLTAESIVIAPPRVARHRYVLDRSGVVGWSSTASWFQRRMGVNTVTVATAAGSEGYPLIDVTEEVGAALLADVSADWLGQFLEPPVR